MFYLISIILIVIIAKKLFSSTLSRKRWKKPDSNSFNRFNELKKDQIQDADFEEID